MSDATPEARRTKAPEPPKQLWADFKDAQTWPEAAPAAAALAHYRDGTFVRVRVEPSALNQYRALAVDAPMPEGARVAAWHESAAGKLLGAYVLEKRGGNWGALQIDGSGALVPGDHAACLRCHDMAPTDHLFGPRAPRSKAPSQPADTRELPAPDGR